MSLGPTCVSAEILKAGGLRTCTYGFDWFRSDFIFWELLIENGLEQFLEKYVYNICIPLMQTENPEDNPNQTSEVSMVKPCYGFNYLYNPHRNYKDKSTKEYFLRCFLRTINALRNDSIIKELVLADYINKQHAVFLDEAEKNTARIQKYLKNAGIKNIRITVIRIKLESDINIQSIRVNKEVKKDFTLWTIYTNTVNDDESNRNLLYKKISDICLLRADKNLFRHQ